MPRPYAWLARFKYVRTIVTQLNYWPRLVRELRDADVVHVFSASRSSFYLAPLPAILVSRLFGKPLIVNYRSGDAEQHLGGSSVARRALKSADLNVVPSSFLRDVFAGFDIPAVVIANVVELEQFRFRTRSPLRPRLLSTRNLDPLYNVACTIRAFARVQARHPDASLTIVGDGPDRSRLRALVRDLRLHGVTFVGQVSPLDICQYYADADIYVQTPSFDNMPASVIEAFACGLPVVSTDVGGVPAILTPGVTVCSRRTTMMRRWRLKWSRCWRIRRSRADWRARPCRRAGTTSGRLFANSGARRTAPWPETCRKESSLQ